MTSWSAASLKPGHRRALVGFDLRLPAIPTLPLLKFTSSKVPQKTLKTATLDPELWPVFDAATAYDSQRNGVNLIDQAVGDFYEGKGAQAAALVAFDIPHSLFMQLAKTFGLRDLDKHRLSEKRWEFLGFDVVDIRTQSSALYSFDLTEAEQARLREAIPLPLNEWGLIDRDSATIALCLESDVVVPGHAPFAPCGVWMALP